MCRNVSIRYMVSEKLSKDGYSLAKQEPLSIFDSMKLFKLVMLGIKEIHDSGNIIPSSKMLDHKRDIKFTNFGACLCAHELKKVSSFIRERGLAFDAFYSDWNWLGHRDIYREDVYKAVAVAAFWMNGRAFTNHARNFIGRDSGAFALDEKYNPIEGLDMKEAAEQQIRDSLTEILDVAHSVDNINDRPDYDGIISQADNIIVLLSQTI